MWHEATESRFSADGRFSNRPFRVKRFQTIHLYSVDVAHGLVLLFGIGTRGPSIMGFEDEVEQSIGGLAVRRTVGPSGHANSPHPSSREGHQFHREVDLRFFS